MSRRIDSVILIFFLLVFNFIHYVVVTCQLVQLIRPLLNVHTVHEQLPPLQSAVHISPHSGQWVSSSSMAALKMALTAVTGSPPPISFHPNWVHCRRGTSMAR
jgi:hypothetical protein